MPRLRAFAVRRFASQIREVLAPFDLKPDTQRERADFLMAWAMFHVMVSPGERPFEAFLKSELATAEQRAFLEASSFTRLSIWGVQECLPGQWLCARDLLTDVHRTIRDPVASLTLRRGSAVLAGLLEVGGEVLFAPAYPRVARMGRARDAVEWFRTRVRARRTRTMISTHLLRTEKASRQLILDWERMLETLEPPDFPPREVEESVSDAALQYFQTAIGGSVPLDKYTYIPPFDPTWFAELPEPLRARAAEALLTGSIQGLEDIRRLLPSLHPLVSPTALTIHAFFRGERTSALPRDPNDRLLTLGMHRFRDDPASAVRHFQQAARGLPHLPHPVAFFHILALHGAGRHEEGERLATLLHEATGHDECASLQRVSRIVRGERLELDVRPTYRALPLLVDALLHFWHGWLPVPIVNALRTAYARATRCGLDWLATQYAALLQAVGPQPGHLTSLLDGQRVWERVLLTLCPRRVVAGRARIAWMLHQNEERAIDAITPREEKPRSVGGGWSSGRPLPLDQVSASPFASPQDTAVAAALLDEGRNSVARAIDALAGHEAVYWPDTPTIPVQIAGRRPLLVVDKTAGGFRVAVRPSCVGALHVEVESKARVLVYAFTDPEQRLAAIFRHGVEVPAAARDALVLALKRAMDDIDVSSTLVPLAKGDPRLFVSLKAYGDECHVSVRVRPSGERGRARVPGEPPVIVRSIDGVPVKRDLDGESALFALLGLPWSDGVMKGDDVLELQERIRALGESAVTRWLQGC
jgi:hypothetical protein